MNYDVVIIGGGVTGSSIARTLSKYNVNVCVLERNTDVCEGTSKANSGIVHRGFDAKTGTLKAKLNVLGSELMEPLSKELDFPYKRNGAMVIATDEDEVTVLTELKERGIANGITDTEILSGDEARELEPSLSKDIVAVLNVPNSGIVCPFNLTVALAENAAENGVEFHLETEVTAIEKLNDEYRYKVVTNKGDFFGKVVVNAAGVYGDVIHNMVSENKEEIIPRRGEYCLYDKRFGNVVERTIFQVPSKLGKGILVTPTVHGNVMVGPNAFDVDSKELSATSKEGLEEILFKASKSLEEMPPKNAIITSFAGLRAHSPKGDFIIEEVSDAKGFVDVIGIESPGLTCAPAIGDYVTDIIKGIIQLNEKANWNGNRKGFVHFDKMDMEERAKLISERPEYGNIICRCEEVSEGEILDAIHRPVGATNIDGLKRRVRTTAGRCQGGFCTPKVIEILSRETGKSPEDVRKSGFQSVIIEGQLRCEGGTDGDNK